MCDTLYTDVLQKIVLYGLHISLINFLSIKKFENHESESLEER